MKKLIHRSFALVAMLVGTVAVGCVGEVPDADLEISDEAEEIGEAELALDPPANACRLLFSNGQPDGSTTVSSGTAVNECIAACQSYHPTVGETCMLGSSNLVVPEYASCKMKSAFGAVLATSSEAHPWPAVGYPATNSCISFCDNYGEWGANCTMGGGTSVKYYGMCKLVKGGNSIATIGSSVPYNNPGCLSWCYNNVPYATQNGYQCVRTDTGAVLATNVNGWWQ